MYVKDGILREVSPLDIREGVIIFPQGITAVEDGAFDKISLDHLTLPEGIISIRGGFRGSNINTVTLPQTCVKIHCGAFNRSSIEKLICLNPNIDLQSDCFVGCDNLKYITRGAQREQVMWHEGSLWVIDQMRRHDIYRVGTLHRIEDKARQKYYFAYKEQAYAIAADLKRAIELCAERYVTPQLEEAYKDLRLDTLISGKDYRRITGACDDGTGEWLAQHNLNWESKKPVEEVLEMLQTQEKKTHGDTFGVREFQRFVMKMYENRAIAAGRIKPKTNQTERKNTDAED